jgi:hypothetical protein
LSIGGGVLAGGFGGVSTAAALALRGASTECGRAIALRSPAARRIGRHTDPAALVTDGDQQMAIKTFDEIQTLVSGNNKSVDFSDQFVICLIWKESGFDTDVKNSKSSATGLMQITKAAVTMTNKNTPKGVHFEHADMTDPDKNIQCGTYYLDIAKNKLGGVDQSYGTGPGYSKSVVTCEGCLKKADDHNMVCLHKIHH